MRGAVVNLYSSSVGAAVNEKDVTMIMIRELGQIEAEQLVTMLNNDEVLRGELGFEANERLTAGDFLREIAEWCKLRRATTYAILADNAAIGTISLSHRSPDGLSARVGYWIGSDRRDLGYCTMAFAALLNQAASEEIAFVSSTISSDNIPSRKIWERHGAVAWEVSPEKIQYRLMTGRRPANAGDAFKRG